MTPWGVAGIVAAIVTFGVCVGTPIVKLVSTLSKLDTTLTRFQAEYAEYKCGNEKEHVALWDRCDSQDDKLENHETRISVLEDRKA